MDSLSSDPVAEVLRHLHRQAEAAAAPLMQTYASEAANPEQAISHVIEAETKDLTGLYRGFAGNFLSVSPDFGRFLYMCARGCKAKRIVEFGSSMGVSAIYMARRRDPVAETLEFGERSEPLTRPFHRPHRSSPPLASSGRATRPARLFLVRLGRAYCFAAH